MVVSVGGHNQISQDTFKAMMIALSRGDTFDLQHGGQRLVVSESTTGQELKKFLAKN